jgi:import receptor subunit TOM20
MYRIAAVHFFKAIKACPSPVELIMILQKALPHSLYSLIVSLFTLDMRVAQNKYFTDFPSVEYKLKLIPDDSEPESELPSLPHHLEAAETFTAGQTIFSEQPISSTLIPSLEGKGFCSSCLNKISGEPIASNVGFWRGTFCSEECRVNGEKGLIDTGKVENEYNKLFALSNTKDIQIPSQISRLLVRLFIEKEEQIANGTPDPAYSNMDHIERHSPARIDIDAALSKEASFLRDILSSKTPGVDQLITDEYYMMIKGRFLDGLILISAPEGVEVPETPVKEDIRKVSELPAIGSGFYIISSWILPSTETETANVKLSFEGDKVTVTALRDIAIGETIRYQKLESSKVEERSIEEPVASEAIDTEQMIAKFMDIMSSGELVDVPSDVETDQNSMVFLSSPEEPAAELESTPEETPVETVEVVEESQPAVSAEVEEGKSFAEVAAEEPAADAPIVEVAAESQPAVSAEVEEGKSFAEVAAEEPAADAPIVEVAAESQPAVSAEVEEGKSFAEVAAEEPAADAPIVEAAAESQPAVSAEVEEGKSFAEVAAEEPAADAPVVEVAAEVEEVKDEAPVEEAAAEPAAVEEPAEEVAVEAAEEVAAEAAEEAVEEAAKPVEESEDPLVEVVSNIAPKSSSKSKNKKKKSNK